MNLVARGLLLTWTSLCGVTYLTGNTAVLISALKYRAISLDKVSVCLICHLAASDLIYTCVYILPTVLTIICDGWVYGDLLCTVSPYIALYSATVSTLILCGLAVSKLTCLIWPLRAMMRSTGTGKVIAGSIWVVSTLPFLPFLHTGLQFYEEMMFRCVTSEASLESGEIEEWSRWAAIGAACFAIYLPVLTVTFTTIKMIFFVKKLRGIQKQAVMTMIAISCLFSVSLLPYGVEMTLKATINEYPKVLTTFTTFIVFLNYTCNPVVYYFTIKSFKRFVQKHLNVMRISIKSKVDTVEFPMTQQSDVIPSHQDITIKVPRN